MNGRSSTESKVPRLRTRIRQATAGAILDAAEEVFADQGLHAAHMGDIAARAGVAVGTLYNHFKDREALLIGLVETRRRDFFQRLDHSLAVHARRPFREQLAGFVAAYLDGFSAHRRFKAILMQGETGAAATYPTASKLFPELVRQLHQRGEKLVKRGLREKALRASDAELHASMLIGCLRGVTTRALFVDGAAQLDAAAVVRFFLDGAAA